MYFISTCRKPIARATARLSRWAVSGPAGGLSGPVAQRAGGGRHDGAAGTRGTCGGIHRPPAPSARALTASATAVPRQSGFAGVSCPTADRCVAVGQRVNRSGIQVPLAEAWNGHRWKVQRARVPAGARTSRLAERWDGTAWSIQRTRG
jgi:hypothetical protein